MGHEIFQRCDSDLDWTACRFCLETGSARLMGELQGKQSMSWMQCLLQGLSESRSRGHSAGEVCWWPHLLTFWGFTKLLFLVILLILQSVYFCRPPSLSPCRRSHGSSWIGFFSYTLPFRWPKSFLTFLEALLPTESTPKSSAFHVLCLFQVLFSSHWSDNMLTPCTAEISQCKVSWRESLNVIRALSGKTLGVTTEDLRVREFSCLYQVTFWIWCEPRITHEYQY